MLCLLFAGLIDQRRWGLEGRFYSNTSMSGEPAVIQKYAPPHLSNEQGSELLGVPTFSTVWKGWIAISQPGTYRFATNSDDGSKLRIDGQIVVDNGGMHGMAKVSGDIALEQGFHEIEIRYVQYGGFSVMQTFWTPPGDTEEPLSQRVLFAARPGPASLAIRTGLRYLRYLATALLVAALTAAVPRAVSRYRAELTSLGMAFSKALCVSSEPLVSPISHSARIMAHVSGAILLLPFFIAAGVFFANGLPEVFTDGDGALLEMSVGTAMTSAQFLGPYSRFGFNHPGPSYFYLLAPLYWLMGRNALSLNVSVLLINASALLAMLIVVWRSTNRWIYAWFVFLMACYMRQIIPILLSIWNPFVAIFPFLLAMLCFAMIASGRFSLFPLAVVAASFAMQTHLGFIPATMAAAICSVFLGGLHVWRGTALCSTAHMRRFLEIGALFALWLWALPIIEQYTHSPGNLSKIIAVFSEQDEARSWNDTFNLASSIFSYFSLTAFSPLSSPIYPAIPPDSAFRLTGAMITVGQFGLLGGMFFFARRRKHPAIAMLALCAAVLSVVMLTSIRRIIGEAHDYLVIWMTTIGVMIWLPCGEFLFFWLDTLRNGSRHRQTDGRRLLEYGLTLGVIALTLLNSEHFAKEADMLAQNRHTCVPNFSDVVEKALIFFRQRHITDCRLAIPDHKAWPAAAGLAVQLDKAGIRVEIDPQYAFQYPPKFRGEASSEYILYVVSSGETEEQLEAKFAPNLERIVKASGARIWMRRIESYTAASDG